MEAAQLVWIELAPDRNQTLIKTVLNRDAQTPGAWSVGRLNFERLSEHFSKIPAVFVFHTSKNAIISQAPSINRQITAGVTGHSKIVGTLCGIHLAPTNFFF
jgi:hypothetical protein